MATMAIDHGSTHFSASQAWRAVERRDHGSDGAFVYAVRSTGIYCKPSCPSRRPSRANVRFFLTNSDAERAGYRACLRCRPGDEHTLSSTDAAVERARSFLDRNAERPVPLSELAEHAGVSAWHLQRSFKRLLGVSPKAYQDARRVHHFKSRLRAGDTVSRATYEAGFGSSSRVYERSGVLLGMTPAAYRRGGAGVRIAYTITDAPVGRVLVATTDRGVCAVELGGTDAEVLRALQNDFPRATIERSDDEHRAWVRAVVDRVRDPGRERSSEVPLDMAGSAFQLRVWKALQEIPAGERRSYREVATAIGRPSATRAVARACATNHLAVVVPCHRVVRSDGELAGYKWGLDRKRRLLAKEGG
ncbi:MAG TPA: bifunctional DNA-binding transcriptional regulator/O6-methylguanine-DNA methyltransferase Ada [Gemmatimonadaceae bacterium]|nr:bifunctional DNA-binding transcriptional regulator/O6-methylguanine-DNA methyltransferase Ada [Gemmatimonadaceae bacterium]